MKIEQVDIDSLKIPPYCQRHHPASQLKKFIAAYKGQYQPIVVSGNEILCGTLVWSGLKKMGCTTIYVNDLGELPEERKKEIRYLDNQIFDIEDWNGEAMKLALARLDTKELADIGFSEAEAEEFINFDNELTNQTQNSKLWTDRWKCEACGWEGTEYDI